MSGDDARDQGRGQGKEHEQDDRDRAMRKAVRLERLGLVTVVVTISLVAIVAGQSQAMKAAWIEDTLSLLPPLAFLVAARRSRRRPDLDHPYGWHRAVGVGHLVASVALLAMGLYLLIDSALGLIQGERAPIGLTVIAGHGIWAGWPMILVMVVTSIPAVLLGFAKMKVAEPIHDKVLYADADMNKADWQSGLATIVGVLGIGLGWWWADAAAAIFVSGGIIHDGVRNVRNAIAGLTDVRARTYDDSAVHPVISQLEEAASAQPWVRSARARVRELGHVLHAEMFVIPVDGQAATLDRLTALHRELRDVDPVVEDVVIAPVTTMPEAFPEGRSAEEADEREARRAGGESTEGEPGS